MEFHSDRIMEAIGDRISAELGNYAITDGIIQPSWLLEVGAPSYFSPES